MLTDRGRLATVTRPDLAREEVFDPTLVDRLGKKKKRTNKRTNERMNERTTNTKKKTLFLSFVFSRIV